MGNVRLYGAVGRNRARKIDRSQEAQDHLERNGLCPVCDEGLQGYTEHNNNPGIIERQVTCQCGAVWWETFSLVHVSLGRGE